MFANYDTGWTVFGVRVPRALVVSVGGVVGSALLLPEGIAAGFAYASGHGASRSPGGHLRAPDAAYDDAASVTLDPRCVLVRRLVSCLPRRTGRGGPRTAAICQ
jgi:hypothetical protein